MAASLSLAGAGIDSDGHVRRRRRCATFLQRARRSRRGKAAARDTPAGPVACPSTRASWSWRRRAARTGQHQVARLCHAALACPSKVAMASRFHAAAPTLGRRTAEPSGPRLFVQIHRRRQIGVKRRKTMCPSLTCLLCRVRRPALPESRSISTSPHPRLAATCRVFGSWRWRGQRSPAAWSFRCRQVASVRNERSQNWTLSHSVRARTSQSRIVASPLVSPAWRRPKAPPSA
mmetsp:Transcript_2100/g.5143  ORF Transcript_2100/g.5143 Transcript_2100/m.5143 type:complete len:233 (+) Transcript_2100:573-1271(+)